jgi:hypothetical protein
MAGNAYTPMINGNVYDWASVKVSMLDALVINVSNIDYSEAQEMELIYGAGVNPVGRGYGNFVPEATITLRMEELESLRNVSPTGKIQDIPDFNIQVSYIPDSAAKITTHKLMNCRFTNNGRTVAQNDKFIEQEIELSISHIEWNA